MQILQISYFVFSKYLSLQLVFCFPWIFKLIAMWMAPGWRTHCRPAPRSFLFSTSLWSGGNIFIRLLWQEYGVKVWETKWCIWITGRYQVIRNYVAIWKPDLTNQRRSWSDRMWGSGGWHHPLSPILFKNWNEMRKNNDKDESMGLRLGWKWGIWLNGWCWEFRGELGILEIKWSCDDT